MILDDLIVDGSLCVGLDCVNGESFGYDTIRLKEHNLRIDFEDNSTAASYPDTEWRIVINDSANGGGHYFAVEDASAGRTPSRRWRRPVEALVPAGRETVAVRSRRWCRPASGVAGWVHPGGGGSAAGWAMQCASAASPALRWAPAVWRGWPARRLRPPRVDPSRDA